MIPRLGSLLMGAFFVFASSLQAADGYTIRTPVLGYVFDQKSGAIHRLDGIPGASWVSEAIDLGLVVTQAHIAPTHRFAIVRDEDGRTLFVDLSAQPPTAQPIEGALEGANGAMISPAARHVALYSTDSGEVQLLEGLPGLPTVGETLQLGRGIGDWTAFAISDLGVIVAASARPEPEGGSLYMLRSGSGSLRIGGVQRAGEVAFFAGSNDAVITDTAADEILVYRDVVARRQSSVIASSNDGVKNPFGAKPTADGRFVAVGLRGGIASVPLYGGAPVFTECACATTSLASLAGGNVFRLTADISAPLQIAEVGAEPRVLFVPALQREDETSQ